MDLHAEGLPLVMTQHYGHSAVPKNEERDSISSALNLD